MEFKTVEALDEYATTAMPCMGMQDYIRQYCRIKDAKFDLALVDKLMAWACCPGYCVSQEVLVEYGVVAPETTDLAPLLAENKMVEGCDYIRTGSGAYFLTQCAFKLLLMRCETQPAYLDCFCLTGSAMWSFMRCSEARMNRYTMGPKRSDA